MTQMMSGSKADPAYEDEERTSDTATLKGKQPSCPSKLSFSSRGRNLHRLAVKWYRSTLYNALILGFCNFLAPGIWGGTIQRQKKKKKKKKKKNIFAGLRLTRLILQR